MRTAAIILAGGSSSRLGEPKQLVRIAGEPLVQRAARIAAHAGCDPVLVVLGARAAEIAAQCDLSLARVVVNLEWGEGIASSIRAGVQAAEGCDVVLMTCDQPAVTAQHLAALVATGRNCAEAVASAYGKIRGIPAYFPEARLRELLLLTGDAGARGLLATARYLNLENGQLDLDTPEALAALRLTFPE